MSHHHVLQGDMSGSVRLEVTHSVLSMMGMMRTFPVNATVMEVKEKLLPMMGTAPEHMRLSLLQPDGTLHSRLHEDNMPLAAFGPQDGMRLHCDDVDPHRTVEMLQDVSQVEKYVIEEEKYDQREDTFRRFKENNPEMFQAAEDARAEVQEKGRVEAEGIRQGQRCIIRNPAAGDANGARGEVMFVGQTRFQPGYWIGIKLDDPLGKNDGSVNGHRYFECEPMHGVFSRAEHVEVGDFPAVSLEDELAALEAELDEI